MQAIENQSIKVSAKVAHLWESANENDRALAEVALEIALQRRASTAERFGYSADVFANDKLWDEVRKVLARHFADRATEEADKVWEEKGWTQDDMTRLLHTHQRRKYNPTDS